MFQQYYSSERAEQALQQPGVLSLISFNSRCEPTAVSGAIPVGLDILAGSDSEIIKIGDGLVERGVDGRCHWSRTGDMTCTSIWLSPQDCEDLQQSTYQAYRDLYGFLQQSEHPYPVRIWNYIPNINHGDGDLEEYKKFCSGRLKAFNDLGIPNDQFPAASALGHHEQGAVIYVLSSASQGTAHENPKQDHAYCYPRQYGPSSPSFSRATHIQLGPQKLLFISGTAGILGHETQAPGNIPIQLETTFCNIETLIGQANADRDAVQSMRVYLRHREDLEVVREKVTSRFPEVPVSFVLGDICRRDLLVEIEATVSCFS